MTLQDQIRQEQIEQMQAPRKPYQWLVQTVSNMFHPLLTLTYVTFFICLYTPMCVYNVSTLAFFTFEVVFYTFLLPALIILLLYKLHIIGHWALRDVRDRTIPFIINFVCYLTNFMVLQRNGFLPDWVLMPYFSSVILTFGAWVISFWWKISAHAMGNADATAFFILMYYYLPNIVPLWVVFGSILITGVVCSTRLYLGRHTMAQLGGGILLGIFSLLIAYYIYF